MTQSDSEIDLHLPIDITHQHPYCHPCSLILFSLLIGVLLGEGYFFYGPPARAYLSPPVAADHLSFCDGVDHGYFLLRKTTVVA